MSKKKEEELSSSSLTNVRNIRSIQIKYINYFLIVIIIFILAFVVFYIGSFDIEYEKIPICGDGTFYNTCSLAKPYFCDDGILIEKASICGCNKNLEFSKENESCVSEYNINSRNITLGYFLLGQQNEIIFTAFEGVYNNISNMSRVIYYEGSEMPSRVDFKLQSISNEFQKEMILPLVKKIQNSAPYDKAEQVRIAIGLVQTIPYGFLEKTDKFGNISINHSRYPYEVLYENQGICGEKSLLLAFLLKEMGYGVSIFYFADENHEAVGIKCPIEKSFYGSGYCFVETGGASIITDFSMEFANGKKLNSMPDILLISDGIPLPDDMYEYKDAKTLNDIRNRNLLGFLKSWKFDKIKEKYGLVEAYELE
ncbi:MAG: hypothetical protein ABIH65_02775 [Nanoarchaeota archaeon]